MIKITRDILDFYKNTTANEWYLKKHFTHGGHLGLHSPNQINPIANKPNGNPFMATVDEHNTYEINNLGFRGKVDMSADVLASGCSITFGIGVPEDGRWTNILGNKMNKNIMNLGNPGGSVETICNHIIRYCMNNKMPKEIFCLMPDFWRNMVVVDKEFYQSAVKRENVGSEDGLQLMFCNPKVKMDMGIMFMEIKDKNFIEDSVSPHQLILNAVNYIYILESFCLVNNIKLYWTTWERASSTLMQELLKFKDFKLKNFVPFYTDKRMDQGNLYIKNTCSLDHDSEFKDSIQWSAGSDYSIIDNVKQPQMAHPGIHFQYHVADFFYNLRNQGDHKQ
jgi:hypothetical protein